MNEIEALSRMVSPGLRRPRVWLGGVMQIMITRACNESCFNCTQLSNLGGKPAMMTAEQFSVACDSLVGYPHVVGVFGGNPCTSPHFGSICAVMREKIPARQRGLWSNHPNGKGSICRSTFNPEFSNLNVHLDREAYGEFCLNWPESIPYLKGLDPSWPEAGVIVTPRERAMRVGDSRHGPPFVAMRDMDVLPGGAENTEENRWDLIADCDINKNWSALIGVFRGELRGYFCELAYAQAALHQDEPDYPDTGVKVEPDWWRRQMGDFAAQARLHCHACGIPLRGFGQLAIGGEREQVSATHAAKYKPKDRRRAVELVTKLEQLGDAHLPRSTDYIQNSALPIIQ